MNLKPNDELMAASFAVASVLAIFQIDAPKLADVKSDMPGNPFTHRGVKSAVLTSAALVTGMALLAKSPTVYVAGGLTIAIEGWKFYHANAVHPATGKVSQSGQTAQYGSQSGQ